jgi:dienelactone hydrolase
VNPAPAVRGILLPMLAAALLLIATSLTALGGQVSGGPSNEDPLTLEPGPWPIDKEYGWIDMSSGVTVDVAIYYPGYERWLDKYYRDQAGPFEVIIFSPGFGTPAEAYEDYLTYWASWGFVVAGVSWEYEEDRAQDVAYLDHGKVIDLLDEKAAEGDLRDPFYGVPDTDHVGAVGHSRGGRAAFMATSQESRILCASSWMPTLNDSLAVDDRAALQLFGGEFDEVAPPSDWQLPLYESIEDNIVYIEVFGGDHGTDRDLHPVMALDLFKYHLKGDRSVESGLQGDELKARAEAGEFHLRMKMGGEVYDSHPELSPEADGGEGSDTSGGNGLVFGLVLLVIAVAIFLYIFIKRPVRAFRRPDEADTKGDDV